MRKWSSFMLLRVAVQFSQRGLLKRLSHCIFLSPFFCSLINHKWVGLPLGSLFHFIPLVCDKSDIGKGMWTQTLPISPLATSQKSKDLGGVESEATERVWGVEGALGCRGGVIGRGAGWRGAGWRGAGWRGAWERLKERWWRTSASGLGKFGEARVMSLVILNEIVCFRCTA